MPCIENWNSKPLEIIKNVFDNRRQNSSWIKQVEAYFSARMKNECAAKMVPSLNDLPLHKLQSGTLVRFRCMVQDTFEPEYYMESYELINKSNGDKVMCSAAYRDIIKCPNEYCVSDATSETGCRQVLYCVAIPAETHWVKEAYKSNNCIASSSKSNSIGRNAAKRSFEDDDDDDEVMEQDQPWTNGIDHSKRRKLEEAGEKKTSTILKKNHPLPNENGAVCIVKVYQEDDNFKINELYEFVGVLSLDPSLEYISDGSIEDTGMEEEHHAHHPPSSFVPRLHCVHMTKLKHNNPLIPLNGPQVTDISKLTVKNEIIRFLKLATFGDELIAEYLLMYLTTRVYSRTGAMAVGKFSLNVSNVPLGQYPKLLAKLLDQLLTKVYCFPMTLNNLNKLTFIPQKNYSTNRLDSGILQVSDGTRFVMDETVLKPGQLDENGVKHVKALSDLLSFQKVDYNFQFHPLVFNVDIPVLVLSEGKSLLPCDCQIPLAAVSIPDDIEKYFNDINIGSDLLKKFRVYLTSCQLDEYELGENMMKVIENDFVSARQQNDENMTADDLHMHLVLARLLSINCGVAQLNMDVWKKVGQFEITRKSRLGRRS